MTEKTGTFLVTHVDADSAVLRDVHDGQVYTLASNPDVEVGDAVEATVAPEPPLEVTWSVVELVERWSPTVEHSEEPPTRRSRELAADLDVGDLARMERAGDGEIHVLAVPPEETADAAAEVADDEETLARAARLGIGRVEIRAADGVVSVRYLP